MCGLIGIVSNNKTTLLEKATNCMAHRGPDDMGFNEEDGIAMGHRRLAIQDLSENGHQPMYSMDGRFVIVFNGEIYNHFDLRQYKLQDVQFKGHSDTETLLYGLIKYGIDFASLLNGIFVFAFYDRLSGDLIICRDQMGVKPIYYYHKGDDLFFASELKALTMLGIDKTLDHVSISNYLYFLYSPGSDTPFKNVKKLAPGHFIRYNTKTPQDLDIQQYYEIPFNGSYSDVSLEEHIEILDQKLTEAVRRQMLSDVPVGFFLSGGLDSSAIVAMARKLFPDRPLSCYTIDTGGGFDGFADDLHYAKKAAEHLRVDLNIVKAGIDIVKSFDEMIWHLDEPQADAAPLNVLNICRQSRQNGDTVLLGGTAGDDLFSGYRRHQALAFEGLFNTLPKPVWKLSENIIKKINSASATVRRMKKLVSEASKDSELRMAGYYGWMDDSDLHKLFRMDIRHELQNQHFSSLLLSSLQQIPLEKNKLNQMLYWDMKYFLTDHNLNYTDKMSMATGVEVRVPFLDQDLVKYSTSVPPALKMKGREVKYILKKTMEKYLPQEIIYRPKTGFGAPVRKWITEDLQPMIKERLSKSELDRWNIFDYGEVQKLIVDNRSAKKDASYSIWALLAIQSWLNQFAK